MKRLYRLIILLMLLLALTACYHNYDQKDSSQDDSITSESVFSESVSSEDDASNYTESEAHSSEDTASDEESVYSESTSEQTSEAYSESEAVSSAEPESDLPSSPTEHVHSYHSEVVKPTCVADGHTRHTCDGCGDSYVDTKVTATGHTWGDWKTTLQPTYSQYGEEKRICSACGAAETRSVAKLTASTEQLQQEVLRLVNVEREKAGLAPLTYFYAGQSAADTRASEITRSFSHTRPNGESCFTVLDDFSYWAAGENIAGGYDSPESVVNAWMNSEGHRANILSADFNKLVVGVNGNYWVQLFVYI